MNIAVFIKNTTLHKSYGGFETQNKLLCEGLALRGHKIVVFSPQRNLTVTSYHENNVEYVFVPCVVRGFNLLFSLFSKTWNQKSIEAYISRTASEKFDLILSQSSGALGLFKVKEKLGVPIVSILHGSKVGEFQSRWESFSGIKEFLRLMLDLPHVFYAFFFTQREFVHGSTRLVAVSNYVKTSIIEETFVSPSKIVVIHNGVKVPAISKDYSASASEKVNFVYLGRLDSSKGVHVLLRAFADGSFKNAFLHIIGAGPELATLKRLAHVLSIETRVHFHGTIPYSQVMGELVKMDIFVLPTLRVEGFPMTIVEAMFCGLPVIASDKGGNSDAVESEKNGYLVKSGDLLELKTKMLLLEQSFELRKQFGTYSRQEAQQLFTLDVMISKYEQVFNEVMNEYSKN